VFGGDVALGGTDSSDLCSGVILRRGAGHTLVQVAEYADRVEPYTFGELAAVACLRYNEALVNIERNMGLGALTAMQHCEYPEHMLYVPPVAGSLSGNVERRYWLQTTATSKKFILDTLCDYMARKALWLRSKTLLEELAKLVKDERNAPVLNGKDRSVALLMAVYADSTTPLAMADEPRPAQKRPPYGVDPYLWKKANLPEDEQQEAQPFDEPPEFDDVDGSVEADSFW